MKSWESLKVVRRCGLVWNFSQICLHRDLVSTAARLFLGQCFQNPGKKLLKTDIFRESGLQSQLGFCSWACKVGQTREDGLMVSGERNLSNIQKRGVMGEVYWGSRLPKLTMSTKRLILDQQGVVPLLSLFESQKIFALCLLTTTNRFFSPHAGMYEVKTSLPFSLSFALEWISDGGCIILTFFLMSRSLLNFKQCHSKCDDSVLFSKCQA